MELVANAHPSSTMCELIVTDESVPVIANALISKCFLDIIKLIPAMVDNHRAVSWIYMRQVLLTVITMNRVFPSP